MVCLPWIYSHPELGVYTRHDEEWRTVKIRRFMRKKMHSVCLLIIKELYSSFGVSCSSWKIWNDHSRGFERTLDLNHPLVYSHPRRERGGERQCRGEASDPTSGVFRPRLERRGRSGSAGHHEGGHQDLWGSCPGPSQDPRGSPHWVGIGPSSFYCLPLVGSSC